MSCFRVISNNYEVVDLKIFNISSLSPGQENFVTKFGLLATCQFANNQNDSTI